MKSMGLLDSTAKELRRMAKPPGALIIKWRDLAESGWTYAKIQREHPQYSANQVRHYCLGTTGRKLERLNAALEGRYRCWGAGTI